MSDFPEFFGLDASPAIAAPTPGPDHPDLPAGVFENGDSEVLGQTVAASSEPRIAADDREKSKAELLEEVAQLRRTVVSLEEARGDIEGIEAALDESEDKYRVLVENANDAIVVAQNGIIRFVNPKATQVSGYTQEELIAKPFVDFVHPDDREFVSMRHLIGLQRCSGEQGMIYPFRIIRKDEREAWVEINPVSITWEGKPATLNLLLDVTERKQAQRTIMHLAYHDALTGLPNRMLFNDRLTVALAQADRNNTRLALVMLDLDRFKDVNDSFGHDTGDALLRAIGVRLREALRRSDTVARMGGDEFLILLPETGGPRDTSTAVAKVIGAFSVPFELSEATITVTASAGVACFPDHGSDPAALMKRADEAMYSAKSNGGNCSMTPSSPSTG